MFQPGKVRQPFNRSQFLGRLKPSSYQETRNVKGSEHRLGQYIVSLKELAGGDVLEEQQDEVHRKLTKDLILDAELPPPILGIVQHRLIFGQKPKQLLKLYPVIWTVRPRECALHMATCQAPGIARSHSAKVVITGTARGPHASINLDEFDSCSTHLS